MDTFFSAVLGDLLSRSISFVIDRCYWQNQGVEENLQRLHRVLLRIQAIVEEANGRHITNQAMIQQLRVVTDVMYRGYYFLDNFRYQIIQGHAQHQVGDRSLDLSSSSALKRLCISTRSWKIVSGVLEKKELQKILGQLERIVSDMQEFVVFVGSYPRMTRQPYCSYLLLENCMFGRKAEQERVINFLLEPHSPAGAKCIDVLPIIGPGRIGKSTLVEHVCRDERVRKYFSTIVFYGSNSIEGGDLTPLTDTGVIRHQNHASTEQSLLIIQLADDMDGVTWRRILHSLSGDHITSVGKIIVVSQSNKVATFGTTEAVRLGFLPKEAFWYFFKTIAFGSTNPDEEPKLASICMEISALLNGSFVGAHVIGGILRSNLNAQFWCSFLQRFKYYTERHIRLLGEHPTDAYTKRSGLSYIWALENQCVAATYRLYKVSSARLNDLPMIVSSDVFAGNVKLQGKFDVLELQSAIPPYYSYVAHYEIVAQPPHVLPKRKRSCPLSEGLV